MKYLKISDKTKLYFENISVECINNAEGVVYFYGSMRNITAAISKILEENPGSQVQCITKTTIKIVDKKHAIMNARVIFDLSKMVKTIKFEDDSTKEKKVKITDSLKHYCKNHDIVLINNSGGAIYFYGSLRGTSAAISKILESNDSIHIQCYMSELVRTETNEKGKEYAIVNECVIFDY